MKYLDFLKFSHHQNQTIDTVKKLQMRFRYSIYFLKTPTSNGKIPRCRNDSNARWSHTDLRDTIFMSSKVSQMIIVDKIPTMNAGVVR